MHLHAAVGGQFCRQLINREIGPDGEPMLRPILDAGELASPRIALPFWREPSGLTLEPNHVIDELDRNAKPTCRLGMRIALLDKCHGARAQLNRMRFTHARPPYLPQWQGITQQRTWEARIRYVATRSKMLQNA